MPLVRALFGSDRALVQTRWLFVAACVGLVTMGVVAAWFISADSKSGAADIGPFLRFMVSPWMLVTHLLALAFMFFGLWFIGSDALNPSVNSDFDAERRRYGRLLVLVFALFTIALSVVGLLFVDDLHATFRQQWFERQQAIVRLKAQQVDKWILDRSLDTQSLAQSLRSLPLDRLAGDREAQQIVRVLFGESLAGLPDRTGAALFAPDGTRLLGLGAGSDADGRLGAHVAALPRDARGITIVDVHAGAAPPAALAMDFVLPLRPGGGDGPALAVLALTADPGRELFKQVALWPTDSPASEVLVVRRDKDDLQFLTPPTLPDRSAAPLSLRQPLSRSDLPGAQAILLGDGVRQGRDSLGQIVYSASSHVTGAPWHVVAKTDVSEAMRPWRRKAFMVASVIGTAIVAAAFMVYVLWRGQRASFRAFGAAQAEERAALARHFEGLMRMTRDPVFLVAPDLRIVDVNEAAVAAYGYTPDEFRALTVRDIHAPQAGLLDANQFDSTLASGGALFETVHRRKDGTTFPVEISTRALDVDGKTYRQSFVRDISRRRALEGDLERMMRVHKALRAAEGILLRARSEGEFLVGTCDVIVHIGGYRVAFVAVANQDAARSVRFLAMAGMNADYVRAAGITWGDGPTGRGPTGMALKTGHVEVQKDFEHNPDVEKWRDPSALDHFRSGVSLPLHVSGALAGTLTVYSALPDAFDAEEVELLSAFADDLSYGMGVIRARGAA